MSTAAAVEVWRARTARTAGGRASAAYIALLVALVTAAPAARAVWLAATSAEGVAALASSAAPAVTALVAAGLWAVALLAGLARGPAILPPFLAHTFATSGAPRLTAFRAPVARSGAAVVATTTLASGIVAASLLAHGLADPWAAGAFVLAWALVGVVATVAWLAGQALPRAAVPGALGILLLAAISVAAPAALPYTPWGWAGLAHPVSASAPALIALAATAVAAVALAPTLSHRLSVDVLITQAVRWESTTIHASGMELAAAASLYQPRPSAGRRRRAIHLRGPLWLAFLVRDAVGAARTPGRLVAGAIGVAAAGVLLALAHQPGGAGAALAAVAGVVLFAGLGPFTDGVRHAASVAGDLPLYGISDDRLLTAHALFPLVAALALATIATLVCALALGVTATGTAIGAAALALLAVAARVAGALKGPLPPVLLTPIPTPVGDLGAAVRLVWALDGVVVAAFAGVGSALVLQAPLVLIGVAGLVGVVGVWRWRARAGWPRGRAN
ncbi:MAG: hypothetical protein QM611_03495 [Microbacterium sp.]|uniref:hypothetical protein n=1 Tax=Microbacterium sp. TaxID=51671 RepID=UPI0039E4BA7C